MSLDTERPYFRKRKRERSFLGETREGVEPYNPENVVPRLEYKKQKVGETEPTTPRRRHVRHVRPLNGKDNEEYGNPVHELCQWDLQPFEGVPWGIPVRYDDRKLEVWIYGCYCSASCVLAGIRYDRPFGTHPESERWLRLMARDYHGVDGAIVTAAPRGVLNELYLKHEHNMKKAIAEFRGMNDRREACYPRHQRFVRVTYLVEEWKQKESQREEEERNCELMQQAPKPLALTRRGQYEQKKFVVKRSQRGSSGGKKKGISGLMGITRNNAV